MPSITAVDGGNHTGLSVSSACEPLLIMLVPKALENSRYFLVRPTYWGKYGPVLKYRKERQCCGCLLGECQSTQGGRRKDRLNDQSDDLG